MAAQKNKLDGANLYIKNTPNGELTDSILTVGNDHKVRQIAKSKLVNDITSQIVFPDMSDFLKKDDLEDYVTLDGTQVIQGRKTFTSNDNVFEGLVTFNTTLLTYGGFNTNYLNQGTHYGSLFGNNLSLSYEDDLVLLNSGYLEFYTKGRAQSLKLQKKNDIDGTYIQEFPNKSGTFALLEDLQALEESLAISTEAKFSDELTSYLTEEDVNIIIANQIAPLANLTTANYFEGDNVFNNVIVSNDGIDSNVAGSLVRVSKNSNETGLNATSFFDTNTNNLEATTSNTISGVFRVTNGSDKYIEGSTAVNLVARYRGTGGGNYLYGSLTQDNHEGSGDYGFIIPHSNSINITGTGVGIVDHARASSNTVSIENPNIIVNNAVGALPRVKLNEGTVGDVDITHLQFDYTAGSITGNFAYLSADNDALPAIGGEAYFINSKTTLPSTLAGVIETDVSLDSIVAASNKVLVTKEYTEANYVDLDRNQNLTGNLTISNASAYEKLVLHRTSGGAVNNGIRFIHDNYSTDRVFGVDMSTGNWGFVNSNATAIGSSTILLNSNTGKGIFNELETASLKAKNLNIAPTSATDTGTTGEIRITSTGIYICVATDTWIKTQLETNWTN